MERASVSSPPLKPHYFDPVHLCLIVMTALIADSGPAGLSSLLPSPSSPFILPRPDPSNPPLLHRQPHMPLTSDWKSTDFSLPAVVGLTGLGSGSDDGDREVDLRKFCLELIARYRYVSAAENNLFHMVSHSHDFTICVCLLDCAMNDGPKSSLSMNCTFPVPDRQSQGLWRTGRTTSNRSENRTCLSPNRIPFVRRDDTSKLFLILCRIESNLPVQVSVGLNDDIEAKWEPTLSQLVKSFLGSRWPNRGWWERSGR